MAFAVAMTAVLAGSGLFVYLRVSGELLAAVDRDLGARSDALAGTLGRDPAVVLAGAHRFVDPDEAFAQILDARGRVVDATPGLGGGALLTPAEAAALSGPLYLTRPASRRQDPQRVLAVPATLQGQPGIVVVGATLGDRDDALGQLVLALVLAGIAAVALSSWAAWLLAGAALAPVERMRQRAADLVEGDQGAALPVPRTGDELARLAETLNSLLERRDAAVQRERRLVDDASHELRTPLAVIKAELDLALSRPRDIEELRRTVRAASGETDRLVRLTEDLLVLARFRQGGLPLRPVVTSLADLVEGAVAPFRAMAGREGRAFEVEVDARAANVDPDRIRQVIVNLVDNALRHGRGTVGVRASVPDPDSHLVLEVVDEGPGWPESLQHSAFEPFHTESGDGSGLGLAIVKTLVEAHGGGVEPFGGPSGGGVRVTIPIDRPERVSSGASRGSTA
jgi:two-component system, OmpR family, sensor kinase